jgi:hypothetical protein
MESGRKSHFDLQVFDVFARLAPELYGEIVTVTRESLQQQLELIIEKYFRNDIAPLMGQA